MFKKLFEEIRIVNFPAFPTTFFHVLEAAGFCARMIAHAVADTAIVTLLPCNCSIDALFAAIPIACATAWYSIVAAIAGEEPSVITPDCDTESVTRLLTAVGYAISCHPRT